MLQDITAQGKGDRRTRISDQARTQDLRPSTEFQPREPHTEPLTILCLPSQEHTVHDLDVTKFANDSNFIDRQTFTHTHTSSPPQSSQPEQTSNQHRLVQALPPPPPPSSAGQGEHRSSQPQRVHHCWEDREVVRRGRGIVRVVRVRVTVLWE